MRSVSTPGPDSRAGLEVRELALSRGGRCICSSLTLVVDAGERLELRGANGAGKTSLLRVLAGLSGDHAGEITWRNARRDERYLRETSYIAHRAGLKPELSPRENLRFYASVKSVEGAEVEAAIEEALARFDLAKAADVPCAALSEGQRRRAALARLPIEKTSVWLLDEPAAALDRAGVTVLEALLVDHAARGGVAVVATHRPLAPTGATRCLELPSRASCRA